MLLSAFESVRSVKKSKNGETIRKPFPLLSVCGYLSADIDGAYVFPDVSPGSVFRFLLDTDAQPACPVYIFEVVTDPSFIRFEPIITFAALSIH
uniref:UDENN domain-containing protein n=1 Tax=Panagrellus redivivus TaxID=6233 RepID=A0A7E4V424_PANRE